MRAGLNVKLCIFDGVFDMVFGEVMTALVIGLTRL